MNKHISSFATNADFTAASNNINYPSVSLIEQTAEIKYSEFPGQNINDASLGDSLIYDTSEGYLMTVKYDDLNSNDYPFARYKAVGVCIKELADGDCAFISSYAPTLDGTSP